MIPPKLDPLHPVSRRTFVKGVAASAGALSAWPLLSSAEAPAKKTYRGPNVILIRFGGGVRRQETIEPRTTYSPYFLHELCPKGTLFPRMEMSASPDCVTSHGEGTLYLLTGRYEKFKDVGEYRGDFKLLGARFESTVPTLPEYLRGAFDIPEHQTLIVNGEDRPDEEFYTFSNHCHYGINYRSNVLSLFRFKMYLLRSRIAAGEFKGRELELKKKELAKMEHVDYRNSETHGQCAPLQTFWERWRHFYGDSGLVNPRGDRLLTELAVRAIKELRPRFMMVNYQDPDYVHWGNLMHYTRGIAIIDEGIKTLVSTVESDDAYRNNTVFVIVPDCGRDNSLFASVPCQHHFGSRSSHEIFALFIGPGIPKGRVIPQVTDQVSVASTLAQLMQCDATYSEGPVLSPVFA